MADAIKATLIGLKRLDKALKRSEERSRAAARGAVKTVGLRTQRAIRADVNRIFSGGGAFSTRRGKGRRVSNAVRLKLFDNRAAGSAALIFSKFGRRSGGQFVDFLGPYITGQEIVPRRSRFLTIPLQPGRRNRSPQNFKNLATVSIAGRLFLIRSTRTRTTFMFLLLPRVKIRKRLRASRIFKAEAGKLARETRRGFRF